MGEAAPRATPRATPRAALTLLLALLLFPLLALAQPPARPPHPKEGPRPTGTFAPGSTGAGGAAASQGLPTAGPGVAPPAVVAADSVPVPFGEFLRLVADFHPVARQAGLASRRAQLDIQQARGAFDPSLNAKYYGKQLAGKDYYHDWETYLRVPPGLGWT